MDKFVKTSVLFGQILQFRLLLQEAFNEAALEVLLFFNLNFLI